MLEQLRNRGTADVNAKDKDGRTALRFVSAKGHEQVVKQLLNRGSADVSAKDNYGQPVSRTHTHPAKGRDVWTQSGEFVDTVW